MQIKKIPQINSVAAIDNTTTPMLFGEKHQVEVLATIANVLSAETGASVSAWITTAQRNHTHHITSATIVMPQQHVTNAVASCVWRDNSPMAIVEQHEDGTVVASKVGRLPQISITSTAPLWGIRLDMANENEPTT